MSIRAAGIGVWLAATSLALAGMAAADEPPYRYEAPAFPAPLPFEPAAWTSDARTPGIAHPFAPRGGTLRLPMLDWPLTLRSEGPHSRIRFLAELHSLVFEPLLELDDATGALVPRLATHWRVIDDGRALQLRLDPDARWSDGRAVSPDDVAATIEHLQRADRLDPHVAGPWQERVETVRALDPHTVEVRLRAGAGWRAIYQIALQPIYPASHTRMEGEAYLRDWNWRLPPGTASCRALEAQERSGRVPRGTGTKPPVAGVGSGIAPGVGLLGATISDRIISKQVY